MSVSTLGFSKQNFNRIIGVYISKLSDALPPGKSKNFSNSIINGYIHPSNVGAIEIFHFGTKANDRDTASVQ